MTEASKSRPEAVYLCLLGHVAASSGKSSAAILRFTTKKTAALLAYLSLQPSQRATREHVAALLWGNNSDRQARQSLRQALVFLRKDLGGVSVVGADSHSVWIEPGSLTVDALEFASLAVSERLCDLEAAVGLLRGPFLADLAVAEEPFEDWVRQQRQSLETLAARALERYALACERLDKGQESLAAVERLVAADPSREDWHRLALRLHAKFAGQDAALARARALAEVLRRDYDLEPDSKTTALVEGIRAGKYARAATPLVDCAVVPQTGAPEDVRAAPVPEERGRLQRAMWPARARGLLARFRLPTAAAAAAVAALAILAMLPHLVASPSKIGSNQAASGEYWRPPPRGHGPTARITAFLVLPFKTHDGASAETQILADIMTDDVITTLSRVPGFRVIARETTRAFKQHPVDIAAIGAELRVHYILDGSLRVRDGALRVNLELIDPATRLSVWTHRVDRDVTDRGGALDEIVGRICRELQSEMPEIEIARRPDAQDADMSTYRGWAAMRAARAASSLPQFEAAAAHFGKALELEPGQLSASLGMASYHANVAAQVLVSDPKPHLARAEKIVESILDTRPNTPAAHFISGMLSNVRGDPARSLVAFQRAIELNPSYAPAHAHLGHVLGRTGQPIDGLRHIQYAMRLSPRDADLGFWHEFACNAELELERYPAAIESCQRATTINPGYPRGWAGLAAAQALAGDVSAAKETLARFRRRFSKFSDEDILRRFGRSNQKVARIREGLRLALQ